MARRRGWFLARVIAVLTVLSLAGLTGRPVSAALSTAGHHTVSATSAAYENGCDGEWAGRRDLACPASDDVATYLQYIKSVPDGVVIALTDEGVSLGVRCEGAARLVRMASDEYARLPADQRAYNDLLWMNPAITFEVIAHSIAAATNIPGLASRGNPINIVFAHYAAPDDQERSRRSIDDPGTPSAAGICEGNLG